MELRINIGYPDVLKLVDQLPEKDVQRLLKQIQIKFENPNKKRINSKSQTTIRELIMQAPTWTDEEYNNYLEVRKHINQSRLK